MTDHSSPSSGPGSDTRQAILMALAKVIATKGITEFSVQAVADEAGVAHRTVYRHFPSREALLEGLAAYLEEWLRNEGLPGVPRSLDELVETIPRVFSFFDARSDLVKAMVLASLAIGLEPEARRARTGAFVDLVASEAPGVSHSEQRRWAVIIRTLASSQSWFTLTDRFGMTSEEAAATVSQGLTAVIDRIREIGGETPGR